MERTLLELGKWGSQYVPPSMDGVTVLHLGSYALTVKSFFRPKEARGVDETYALHIGDEILRVGIKEGEIDVRQGETRNADVAFHTDMPSFLGLFSRQIHPDEAVAAGLIRIESDPGALRRFLRICGLPDAHTLYAPEGTVAGASD